MDDGIPVDEITLFFEKFAQDFSTFSGRVIAKRYKSPFLVVNADGAMCCLSTHAEIEQYFQRFLDQYKTDGIVGCTFRDLTCSRMGKAVYLATVNWQLNNCEEEEVSGWRESYSLLLNESEFKVVFSADF